jgi:cytochrome b subunit of formate dehydrogenase
VHGKMQFESEWNIIFSLMVFFLSVHATLFPAFMIIVEFSAFVIFLKCDLKHELIAAGGLNWIFDGVFNLLFDLICQN